MNIYTTMFFVKCPSNGIRVQHNLEIKSEKMIKIELILEFISFISDGFHEDIADKLFEKFGGIQKLIANHHSVNIETIRQ